MPFDGPRTDTTEYLEKLDAIIDLLGTPQKWDQGHLAVLDIACVELSER